MLEKLLNKIGYMKISLSDSFIHSSIETIEKLEKSKKQQSDYYIDRIKECHKEEERLNDLIKSYIIQNDTYEKLILEKEKKLQSIYGQIGNLTSKLNQQKSSTRFALGLLFHDIRFIKDKEVFLKGEYNKLKLWEEERRNTCKK